MPSLAQPCGGGRCANRRRKLGVEGGRVHRKTLRKDGTCRRGSRAGASAGRENGAESGPRAGFSPGAGPDVQDLGMEYRFVLAVPNVCSSDIKVEASRDLLAISSIGDDGERRPLCGMRLPGDVATDFITAELAGVILSVILPKAKPRAIQVTPADEGSVSPSDARCADIIGDWLVTVGEHEIRLLRPLPPACWKQDAVRVGLLGNRVTISGPDGAALDGFRVPNGVRHEGIEGTYREGVLTLVLPRDKSRRSECGSDACSWYLQPRGGVIEGIKVIGDFGAGKGADGPCSQVVVGDSRGEVE